MLAAKPITLNDLVEDTCFDVIVLGAGGAGLATALFAALEGADHGGVRVLVVESTASVGGTTSHSAGTLWIPGTALGARVNPKDHLEEARRFLDAAVGSRSSAALREAFLRHGPAAVHRLLERSHVALRARRARPDFEQHLPGAALAGRALEPLPFDAHALSSADLALIRPPPPEFLLLGRIMTDRRDMSHLRRARESFKSLRHVGKLLMRYAIDRLRHGRSTRLLRGPALIGQLLQSLREHDVTVLTRTRAIELHRQEAGAVTGVTLTQGTITRQVSAKGGIVLATGGFNRHPIQRASRLPGVDAQWCPGAAGHTGGAHALAEQVGAVYGTGALSNAYWVPVSLRRRRDASMAAIPHFGIDQAMPRMMMVDARGQRVADETSSHHALALNMHDAHTDMPGLPTYLITDANGLQRYGLGMVRAGGLGLKSALADGYIVSAPTLRDLANKLEIRAAPLDESLHAFNARWGDAVGAHDTLADAVDRAGVDWQVRASQGPVRHPPYYAVQLYPGDLAAATGFLTDPCARMLDAQGRVIPGLYAAGTDMHSIMGGMYPASGCVLGPALVFADLAGRDAVQRARDVAAGVRPTIKHPPPDPWASTSGASPAARDPAGSPSAADQDVNPQAATATA